MSSNINIVKLIELCLQIQQQYINLSQQRPRQQLKENKASAHRPPSSKTEPRLLLQQEKKTPIDDDSKSQNGV